MRPKSWLAIASAIALVVGIGLIAVVALISARGGALTGGSASDPVSSVIEPAQADPLPVVGPSGSPAPALEEGPSTVTGPGESLIQVPTGGADAANPTLSAAPSLGDAQTAAAGYRFVDAGLNRAALATVLARKFGIEGRPTRSEDGTWVVTPSRHALPRVRVEAGPMATWTFDWMPQAVSASASTTAASTPAASTPAPSVPVSPVPVSPLPVSPVLDGRAAEQVARSFLSSLGVPTDELDWQVEAIGASTVVTGWQVIAGQRTQAGWQMAFAADGQVTQASGFAATAVEMPGLPVLGPTAALARARQSKWSALGPTLLATAPGPRKPVIVSADLGLAQFTQPDGRLLILPAYVLTAEDGSTWSLVAVADEALSLVPD